MTCADYVISMNFNSLESRFHNAHRRGLLSDSSYTLVKRAIDTYKKERAKALAPYVNSSVSKVCLLDALRILDEKGIRLIENRRNLAFIGNSTDVINAIAQYDIKMRSTMTAECMKYLVLVAAIAAANYAILLGKKVESETMMKLSLDESDKTQLIRNFENAQEMLDQFRHFNLNKMDGTVLHVEAPKQSGTVSTAHRAW